MRFNDRDQIIALTPPLIDAGGVSVIHTDILTCGSTSFRKFRAILNRQINGIPSSPTTVSGVENERGMK